MSVIDRQTVVLTGMPGLPGTNTFYSDPENIDPPDFTTATHDFFDSFHTNLADDLHVTVQGALDRVESTTGVVVGQDDGGDNQVVVGGNSGDFLPLATQLLVQWRTGVYFGGRELRGRTFLAGFVTGLNDNGVPNSDLVAAVEDAANTFALALVIYSPTKREWASVSHATVWTEWAELRSRRD